MGKFTKIVDKRGRTGKKRCGLTSSRGGDTRVKSIKVTVSDEQKRSSFFQKKINRGDTGELGDGDD